MYRDEVDIKVSTSDTRKEEKIGISITGRPSIVLRFALEGQKLYSTYDAQIFVCMIFRPLTWTSINERNVDEDHVPMYQSNSTKTTGT